MVRPRLRSGGVPALDRDRAAAPVESDLRALFPRAAGSTIQVLAATARLSTHVRGEPITAASGVGAPVTLVRTGVVARLARSAEGREVAYGVLRPGEIGGIAQVTPGAHEELGLAAWSSVQVATWSGAVVRREAAGDAAFALALLDLSAEVADAIARELEAIVAIPAVHRLARALLRYQDLYFHPERPFLRRGTLAILIGTSREMMERCMRELETNLVVQRTESGGLVLLDGAGLAEVAQVAA